MVCASGRLPAQLLDSQLLRSVTGVTECLQSVWGQLCCSVARTYNTDLVRLVLLCSNSEEKIREEKINRVYVHESDEESTLIPTGPHLINVAGA